MSKQYAVVSVSDKTGIVDLGAVFNLCSISILSTGGTYKALSVGHVYVTQVSEFTGAPEIMKGRVKTIHPKIAAGILHRRDVSKDTEEMVEAGYGEGNIDYVIVNLYPFQQTITKPGVTEEEAVEQIDIGGPTMIRAAAKNFKSVCVIVDPADYPLLVAELEAKSGKTTLEFRKKMAAKAFAYTCEYELAIARYLSDGDFDGFTGHKVAPLKYGENPQQQEGAALFTLDTDDPLAIDQFEIIDGSPCGFINNTDLHREIGVATRIAVTLRGNIPDKGTPFIAIAVKHGNACGVGVSYDSPEDAIRKMVEGNPLAIFGGFILTNFHITLAIAKIMRGHCVETGMMKRLFDGIVVPGIDDDAIPKLRRKDGGYRIMVNPALLDLQMDSSRQFRYVRGGFQTQPPNKFVLDFQNQNSELQIFCELTDQQKIDASIAKAICDESTSNTILAVKDGRLLGNGTCRPSRISATWGCIQEATSNGLDLEGAIVASDSFYPATDGPQEVIDAKVAVVVTTSGSRADETVFKLFADAGVTVVAIPNSVGRGFNGH